MAHEPFRPKPGTTSPMEDLGPCPSCGRRVGIVFDEAHEPVGLAHDMPMCPQFDALPVDKYAEWMRQVREAALRPSQGEES